MNIARVAEISVNFQLSKLCIAKRPSQRFWGPATRSGTRKKTLRPHCERNMGINAILGNSEYKIIISMAYHAMITLMIFDLLLCLSSPNFPPVLMFYF